MYTKTIAMALAGALLATPMIASAEPVRETRSIAVSYADLDLTTPEGQHELQDRIRRAARDVCGMDEQMTGSNMASESSRACYREARRHINREFASIVESAARGG